MSPEIRIYDRVEIAIAAVEGRDPNPRFSVVTETEKSQQVIGENGDLLEINMDGINGNRPVQHVVLEGTAVGGRHSIKLDNLTGRARDRLKNGDVIDVIAPSALEARQKKRQEGPVVTHIERVLRDFCKPVPGHGEIYVEG